MKTSYATALCVMVLVSVPLIIATPIYNNNDDWIVDIMKQLQESDNIANANRFNELDPAKTLLLYEMLKTKQPQLYEMVSNNNNNNNKQMPLLEMMYKLNQMKNGGGNDEFDIGEPMPQPEAFHQKPLTHSAKPNSLIDSDSFDDKDKRGNYMSLCHFKICNMGRKRNLRTQHVPSLGRQ